MDKHNSFIHTAKLKNVTYSFLSLMGNLMYNNLLCYYAIYIFHILYLTGLAEHFNSLLDQMNCLASRSFPHCELEINVNSAARYQPNCTQRVAIVCAFCQNLASLINEVKHQDIYNIRTMAVLIFQLNSGLCTMLTLLLFLPLFPPIW